jgi:hypothetical protein
VKNKEGTSQPLVVAERSISSKQTIRIPRELVSEIETLNSFTLGWKKHHLKVSMDEDAFMDSVLQPPPAASASSTGEIDNGCPSASAGQPTTTAGFQQFSLSDNLKPNQVACEYNHRRLLEKVGAIITFISTTYHDSVLGSLRTNVVDPRLVPAYLSKYNL